MRLLRELPLLFADLCPKIGKLVTFEVKQIFEISNLTLGSVS